MATVSAAYVDAEEPRIDRATVARRRAPSPPTASAIAGVDQAPTEDDIARTADSILAGAFTGDFAVALERAAAFTDVVALGLRIEARKLASLSGSSEAGSSDVSDGSATSAAAGSRRRPLRSGRARRLRN